MPWGGIARNASPRFLFACLFVCLYVFLCVCVFVHVSVYVLWVSISPPPSLSPSNSAFFLSLSLSLSLAACVCRIGKDTKMSQANNTRVWIDSMEVRWVLQIWLFSFHRLLPLFLSPLRVWMTTSANPWISSGCRKFLTNGGERRQRSDEMAWYLLWHLQVMTWYISCYIMP